MKNLKISKWGSKIYKEIQWKKSRSAWSVGKKWRERVAATRAAGFQPGSQDDEEVVHTWIPYENIRDFCTSTADFYAYPPLLTLGCLPLEMSPTRDVPHPRFLPLVTFNPPLDPPTSASNDCPTRLIPKKLNEEAPLAESGFLPHLEGIS